MKHLVFGGFMLLSMASSAFAGECPSGMTLPEIEHTLEAQGFLFAIVAPDQLDKFVAEMEKVTGDDYGVVTNALVAQMAGHTVFGVEVDGCMSKPIPFPEDPKTPARFSGALPDGRIGA